MTDRSSQTTEHQKPLPAVDDHQTTAFQWPTLGSCVKSWEGTCGHCGEPYPPETRITSRFSPTRFTISCQCSLDKHVMMEVAGTP